MMRPVDCSVTTDERAEENSADGCSPKNLRFCSSRCRCSSSSAVVPARSSTASAAACWRRAARVPSRAWSLARARPQGVVHCASASSARRAATERERARSGAAAAVGAAAAADGETAAESAAAESPVPLADAESEAAAEGVLESWRMATAAATRIALAQTIAAGKVTALKVYCFCGVSTLNSSGLSALPPSFTAHDCSRIECSAFMSSLAA
mmetsp:Transcript_16581/g.64739  ORF Transcript_16581/g.64739 Transcript_16581/m.64739 type:complete len:211 (-) Transcript_16581:1256-1888(-)